MASFSSLLQRFIIKQFQNVFSDAWTTECYVRRRKQSSHGTGYQVGVPGMWLGYQVFCVITLHAELDSATKYCHCILGSVWIDFDSRIYHFGFSFNKAVQRYGVLSNQNVFRNVDRNKTHASQCTLYLRKAISLVFSLSIVFLQNGIASPTYFFVTMEHLLIVYETKIPC